MTTLRIVLLAELAAPLVLTLAALIARAAA